MENNVNVINDMSEKVKEIDSRVKEENMVLAAANLTVSCLVETNKEERLALQQARERDIKRWQKVAFIASIIAILSTLSAILMAYSYLT